MMKHSLLILFALVVMVSSAQPNEQLDEIAQRLGIKLRVAIKS